MEDTIQVQSEEIAEKDEELAKLRVKLRSCSGPTSEELLFQRMKCAQLVQMIENQSAFVRKALANYQESQDANVAVQALEELDKGGPMFRDDAEKFAFDILAANEHFEDLVPQVCWLVL